MGNIRINKLALELNVQNDQIIEELQKHDIHVKNYMSAIDDDMAEKIREQFPVRLPRKKMKQKIS